MLTLGIPFVPPVRYAPPVTEPQPLRRTSLCTNTARASKNLLVRLNKEVASADWSPIYQQNNAKSNSEKFSNLFENILNHIAPNKIGEPSSKATKKKWLSRELLNLINKKHRLFNIWKEKADVDTYNS